MADCRQCDKREPRILEENEPVIRLMLACQTQWRIGFAGATGLDYNALFSVAGALRIEMNAKILRGISVLEGVTLEKWHKKQNTNGE
jgi:hypothetical protein